MTAMIFLRVKSERLAHMSYFIGSGGIMVHLDVSPGAIVCTSGMSWRPIVMRIMSAVPWS